MNPQRPKSATARSQIKVWLPTPMYEMLKAAADEKKVSMTALITQTIADGLIKQQITRTGFIINQGLKGQPSPTGP